MPPPEVKGTLILCNNFEPNPYWIQICGDFCVQKFCKKWIHEKKICTNADSAGCTYEVIEAHCTLREDKLGGKV